MQRTRQFNQTLINNLLWFLASLGLAIFVWLIASTQADPVARTTLEDIEIQYQFDDNLVPVDLSLEEVDVDVRARQSVIEALTANDVIVTADFTGFGAGTHTVELDTSVARRAVADTRPAIVSIDLEPIESRLIEIRSNVTEEPPLGFRRGATDFSETEVRITGAASLVSQVERALVNIDLAEQRANLEERLPVILLDDEDNPVNGLAIEPQSVLVNVPVIQREDVAEVQVVPDVDTATLEDGYEIDYISYTPQTIFVSGNLNDLPDSLSTERISLTGRNNDFEETVSIDLPANVLILSERNVTVSIGLTPVNATRTFEDVPVNVIGLGQGLEVDLIANQVTVIVTGPQARLSTLEAGDVQVVLDLNNLEPGNYDITPTTSISQAEIQVVPAVISVTISESAEATEPPPGS